jgi:hypothetical protein
MFGGLGVDMVHHDDGKSRNLRDLHQFRSPVSTDSMAFYDFGQPDDDDGGKQREGGGQRVLKRNKRRVDFIDVLPAEISLHILSFLAIADVGATLPLVSKTWQR